MKNVQVVMDHTGDSKFTFSPTDEASVREAMERFKDLTTQGYTAAEKTGPGTSKLVNEFNPTATETLFFPRIVGG